MATGRHKARENVSDFELFFNSFFWVAFFTRIVLLQWRGFGWHVKQLSFWPFNVVCMFKNNLPRVCMNGKKETIDRLVKLCVFNYKIHNLKLCSGMMRSIFLLQHYVFLCHWRKIESVPPSVEGSSLSLSQTRVSLWPNFKVFIHITHQSNWETGT